MLTVTKIAKTYSGREVLHPLSFEIGDGEICGLLGPNGAGKSTTMKIICGITSPDGGEVLLDGENVFANPLKAKRSIGYLPENNPLYGDMTVREFLLFMAGLQSMKGAGAKSRVDEVMGLTGLAAEAGKQIRHLSKGYKQRVGLSHAILHSPRLLVLDEPTTGLDPNQIIEIRRLIKELGRSSAVLFSTHLMQEAAAVCDKILILNKGSVAAAMPVEGRSGEELEALFEQITK